MEALYRSCRLCPRLCAADRLEGPRGFCGEGASTRAAWAGLHFGEEPAVTGRGGSGAVFFSGCTLKCPFCQNYQLSRQGLGVELSERELVELMLRLQQRGAENINLVTATQFTPGLLASIAAAREEGLEVPVLWNSSGYELPETVELLSRQIDIFLPDCKTLDPHLGAELLGAEDYPTRVREALLRMAVLKPLRWQGEVLAQGVMVRHLVIPGCLESTRVVLEWFRGELYGRALLSLMFQYTPAGDMRIPAPEGGDVRSGTARRLKGPDRGVRREEYEQVLAMLDRLGIEEGYFQEPEPGEEWLPDFRRLNPFPAESASPLWHYSLKGPIRERLPYP